ncbi:uncharacterized protein BDV14DRAFT_201807 [Aspergillus stella-maris]|uniref:uncharacterized protein n=1 Tax=Aspergillus stella-maris TaxID=1810926 RepID=UPI003CCDF3A8
MSVLSLSPPAKLCQTPPPLPPLPSLAGTWLLTRSSSPFWRDKHSISITFSLDASRELNDPVYTSTTVYQTSANSSATPKTVSGTDRQVREESFDTGATVMEWRGSGWLKMVRARWEILGIGKDWMVVYTNKSMFTPAGISICSREKEMGAQLEDMIQDALKKMIDNCSSEELVGLVKNIVAVGG